MLIPTINASPIERVRGILLTNRKTMLMIKRVKPHNPQPYWVAPGGGVEPQDKTLRSALVRELDEELGAQVDILQHAFTLRHEKGGKDLREYFYVCRLKNYDLKRRNGPEFGDPTRGEYIPDEVPLTAAALKKLNMKTPELTEWLTAHMTQLQGL
jgi:8-oxo-dGTP pyrophosphatase MutT (NUDIX family)